MLPIEVLSAGAGAKGLTSHSNATIVRHSKVILRFEKFLQANRHWPVSYVNICAAIGVPERTLRAHCQELLGTGTRPMLYVRLRRMRMARAALLRADPAITTVTRVAARFGFSELGRFSVEYGKMFGEPPSTTLQRPPKRMQKRTMRSTRSRRAA